MPAIPTPLVETHWLEAHLNEPELCVYDCTVFFTPPEGRMQFESGRSEFEKAHIPGAGFIDVLDALSDPASALSTQRPSPERFAEAMSEYGIDDHVDVVLYDKQMSMWATRVWWMLRAMGFDRASVLNGGWHKWTKEGRAVTSEPSTFSRAHFVTRPRPGLFVDKDSVLAGIDDENTTIVSALMHEMHAGGVLNVCERGHIASSTCVPAFDIVDQETMTFLPPAELRKKFDGAGATADKSVITYCGTGIAATSNAFALRMLGHERVSVYDGSLEEWSADPNLPMEK